MDGGFKVRSMISVIRDISFESKSINPTLPSWWQDGCVSSEHHIFISEHPKHEKRGTLGISLLSRKKHFLATSQIPLYMSLARTGPWLSLAGWESGEMNF